MFTPEDGTGLAAANSYCDVAYADAYHALRGNAAWTGPDSVKQAALVKATDYIDQTYPFVGEPLDPDQALAFPRLINEASSGVPDRLKQATSQLALEALTKDLSPNTDTGAVKRKRVEGAVEIEYFAAPVQGTIRRAIAGLLKGFTIGRSLNVSVIRL